MEIHEVESYLNQCLLPLSQQSTIFTYAGLLRYIKLALSLVFVLCGLNLS